MASARQRKLHKNVQVAFSRLHRNGKVLCRQSSESDEAERGGGYIYFAKSNNAPISPSAAKFLIDNGLVNPTPDGLFCDTAQSFEAIEMGEFDRFKASYEAQQNA